MARSPMILALTVALTATTAGCLHIGSDDACRTVVELELDYDATSQAADTLSITLAGSTHNPFVVPRVVGRAKETLDVKLERSMGTATVLATIVASRAGSAIGSGKTSLLPECPSQILVVPIVGLPPPPPPHTCGNCGSGVCGGVCNTKLGVCDFSGAPTSCALCKSGTAFSDGNCVQGTCQPPADPGTTCDHAICGDSACATVTAQPGAIVAGPSFSCVGLGVDNEVRCWGSNKYGILGRAPVSGLADQSDFPTAVAGTRGITALAAGSAHVCGVQGTQIVCWGSNATGQLGTTADNAPHAQPSVVVGLPPTTTSVPLQLAASSAHSCVVIDGRSVYCWGYNLAGELGATSSWAPHAIDLSPLGANPAVKSVALGESHLCVAAASSTPGMTSILCYGSNEVGQLGSTIFGTSGQQSRFEIAMSQPQLVANGDVSCAFVSSAAPGNILCWGNNADGELGIGSKDSYSSTPVSPCSSSHCDAIGNVAIGAHHVCAGFADGVYCWGGNSYAQLGFPPPTTGTGTRAPTLAVDPASRAFVANGADHSCAIGNFGGSATPLVYCWGANSAEEAGQSPSTTAIPGPPRWF